MTFEDAASQASDPFAPNLSIQQKAKAFLDAMDMPNAILLFEDQSFALAEHFRERQDAAISAGIPAFFSSFMPKSGGTFLHNRIVELGAVEIYNHVPNPINYLQAYLIEGWLKTFLRGGSACHSHMELTPYNLSVIRKAHARKIWIHMRDPRQVALSVHWHQRDVGQGSGPIAELRIQTERQVEVARRWLSKKLNRPHFRDMDLDSQVKEAFLLYQQWASRWIMAGKSHPDLAILFTTFENMAADRMGFQRQVFDFFEFDYRGPPAFERKSTTDRFRSGRVDEWRQVYSAELQHWLTQRTDPQVYDFMGWRI